jgi:hypothetical protein
MKLTKMAFAAAVAWGIYAGSAHAQQTQGLPASYSAADYYYFQQDAAASPSDQAPAVQADKMMVQAPAGACDACLEEEEAECEQWHLFCQKECGWNVYGFAAAGVTANEYDTPSRFNGPVTFNDRREGMLNQFYAITEKTVDTGGCGWDWGGRVDLLYGSDYIFTQAVGLETTDDGAAKWNSSPYYGLAMPQAYAEVGYNDWTVKLGHFYTVIGYEVVPANGNFFYSHAYTMQYGEPFTHTGALATYKYNDRTNVFMGLVNGWDNFDRINDTGAFLGGFTWNNGDRLSLALTGIVSPNEPTATGTGLDTNRDMYSFVMSYQLSDSWQYVFQQDTGYQKDGSIFTDGATSAEWYGVNQYLFYTLNDCWKFGGRFEWFRDDDGVRVAAVRPGNPTPNGFAGNFYEVTMGANWTPHANWVVRPEVRFDWYDGETLTGLQPYNDGDDDSQITAAFDVIFLW